MISGGVICLDIRCEKSDLDVIEAPPETRRLGRAGFLFR